MQIALSTINPVLDGNSTGFDYKEQFSNLCVLLLWLEYMHDSFEFLFYHKKII